MKLKAVIVIGLLIALVPGMVTWFGYHSALSKADEGAIEWLNQQGNSAYTCSAEIAPWIYGRYVDMRYVDRIEDADYVVLRTEPMTPRCDKDNIFYGRGAGVEGDGDEEFELMELLTQFRDGEIMVKIYRGGHVE